MCFLVIIMIILVANAKFELTPNQGWYRDCLSQAAPAEPDVNVRPSRESSGSGYHCLL